MGQPKNRNSGVHVRPVVGHALCVYSDAGDPKLHIRNTVDTPKMKQIRKLLLVNGFDCALIRRTFGIHSMHEATGSFIIIGSQSSCLY